VSAAEGPSPGDELKRTFHLPVLVKTWGRSCNNEYADDGCPLLQQGSNPSTEENGDTRWICAATGETLRTDSTLEIGLWLRTDACLRAERQAKP